MATTLSGNGIVYNGSTTDPSAPVVGQVYLNTATNRLRLWDGKTWNDIQRESDFLNRQIISTGYVMGGYKSSAPWQNVNSISHSTDIMINHGDLMGTAGAYISGACSLTIGYIWGVDATWPGTSTGCGAFNMYTLTNVAAPTMIWARNDSGTLQKEHEMAWIIGGAAGAGVDRFNLTTNTMDATDPGITGQISGSSSVQYGVGTHFGEIDGYCWQESNTGAVKFTFATQTFAAANAGGNSGQQKGISSKHGVGYAGNEGTYNGGYNLRRMNYTTGTATTTVPKPHANCGEENFDMGQHHQYCMGQYDGAQNNRGWKFSYTTDNGYELGAGSVRTGVPGGSSGHCAWRG